MTTPLYVLKWSVSESDHVQLCLMKSNPSVSKNKPEEYSLTGQTEMIHETGSCPVSQYLAVYEWDWVTFGLIHRCATNLCTTQNLSLTEDGGCYQSDSSQRGNSCIFICFSFFSSQWNHGLQIIFLPHVYKVLLETPEPSRADRKFPSRTEENLSTAALNINDCEFISHRAQENLRQNGKELGLKN